jgi:hypothetical protein
VRNNLVWDFSGHGTAVMDYGSANIVNNYYYTAQSSNATQTISLGYGGQPVSAYLSGNRSHNGWNLNGHGTRTTPHAAIEPKTSDALTAAREVLAFAGARGPRFGLDSIDAGYVSAIALP